MLNNKQHYQKCKYYNKIVNIIFITFNKIWVLTQIIKNLIEIGM